MGAFMLLAYFSGLTPLYAQSNAPIFRDDFNREELGEAWGESFAWGIVAGSAFNYIDGTGGSLRTAKNFDSPSYVIETVGKGFTINYERQFRIVFGQTKLGSNSAYVLSYTPYSGGKLALSRATDNIYYGDILDEISIYPDLATDKWYQFKIAKYKSGLIQVYVDQGAGYSAIPLLEAIDNTYPTLGHFGWQIDTQTFAEEFYVDWVEAAQPAVEKPAVREKPVPDDLITQVSAASGRHYSVAKLKTNEKVFTDRTYTVTALPPYLEGASFIQTAAADKEDVSDTFLTMFLQKQVIVYVAYDPRATSLPAWLTGWKKTGDIIQISDPEPGYLELYSKLVENSLYPDPFLLGGNLASPAAGAQQNYMVAAVEEPADITLEAEDAKLSGAKVDANHVGYSGTGFVNYINPSHDYIEWTVNITTPGSYGLGFVFANGSQESRALHISLDGAGVNAYSFIPTSSGWESWAFTNGPRVYLSPGTHKIRATAINNSGPNMDYLRLNYVASGAENSPALNALKVAAKVPLRGTEVAVNAHLAYPNPFANSTTIAYSLAEKMPVTLTIFTLQGQKVQELVHQQQEAGQHQVEFKAATLAKGIYLYQLRTGNTLKVGKIVKQ